MAAEYDMQDDRGLDSLPLFHTMIRYNAAHHMSNNKAELNVHPAYITYTLLSLFAQARYRVCGVRVKCLN